MRNIAQQDEEKDDSVPAPAEDHHQDDLGM